MTASPTCSRCGFPIPAGDRFCQRCGSPVPVPSPEFVEEPPQPVQPPQFVPPAPEFLEQPRPVQQPPQPPAESVVGHLPADLVEEGRGLFGRPRSRTVNLVVTTHRVLCLRETLESNDLWLSESERLEDESQRTGVPVRTIVESYDWRAPLWASFYTTPPEALLAEGRWNWALPLAGIVEATMTLDPDMDKLDLRMDNGQVFEFRLYNAMGLAAARFLAQAMGPQRVQVRGMAT